MSRNSLTLKLGTEIKSPSSSKNIKIIDQFEIKENVKTEPSEDVKAEFQHVRYEPRGSLEMSESQFAFLGRGSHEDIPAFKSLKSQSLIRDSVVIG